MYMRAAFLVHRPVQRKKLLRQRAGPMQCARRARTTGKLVRCMEKFNLIKKYALRAVCLMMVMVCIIFPSGVQAAEEGGMTQPSSAKIYSSMSENSDIIANLIVGNAFEVLEAENDASGGIWYRVRTDFGAEGYVKAGEMDKLIMDAQALMPQAAADTGGQEPVPEGDNDGEEPAPGENNGGDEAQPDEDNAGEEPPADENNGGEEPQPDENNAGEEPSPDENNIGEEQALAENFVGEEPVSGETVSFASEPVSDSDTVDGAGFGQDTDSQGLDSTMIGSEEFTVIERTENSKTHRFGGIDAVLIMILAGGILCIIAIAALLKRIMKCIRMEM